MATSKVKLRITITAVREIREAAHEVENLEEQYGKDNVKVTAQTYREKTE